MPFKKTRQDAQRIAEQFSEQTGRVVSDGSYKAMLFDASYKSLYDHALSPAEADLLLQELIGNASIYPATSLTPETQVVRHVFRTAANRRMAISMIEVDESEAALRQDAAALGHLIDEMGVGPFMPNPVRGEEESIERAQGDRVSWHDESSHIERSTLVSRVTAAIGVAIPFMGEGSSSAKKTAEKAREEIRENRQGNRNERFEETRTNQRVTENRELETGYEKTAIVFQQIARHYKIPSPADLKAQSVLTLSLNNLENPSASQEMGVVDMSSLLRKGGQSSRYQAFRATEWALLKAAYRATETAMDGQGERWMSNDLKFIFENGYTHEVVEKLRGRMVFAKEIRQGQLNQQTLAYNLAAYALTFRAAADCFVKSLAEYANHKIGQRDIDAQVVVEPRYNPADHPNTERVRFQQPNESDADRLVAAVLGDMDAPVFVEKDPETGAVRYIVASEFVEEAEMSVLPSDQTFPPPGLEPRDPDLAARERQAIPMNTRLAKNTLKDIFGVEGQADPTRVLKIDDESVWSTLRMHQGELPDMTPEDDREAPATGLSAG